MKPRFRIALLVGGSVLLTLLIIMFAFNIIMQRRIETNADKSLRAQLSGEREKDSMLYTPDTIAVLEEEEDTAAQLYSQKELSIISWSEDKALNITERAEIDGNEYYILSVEPSIAADDTLTSGFTVSKDQGFVVYQFSQYITDDSDPDDTGFNDYENSIVFEDPDAVDAEDGEEEIAVIAEGEEQSTVISEDAVAEDSFYEGSTILFIPQQQPEYLNNLQKVVGYVDVTGELELIRQINTVFLMAALAIGIFGSTMGFFIGRKLEQNQLAQKQFFENTSHELKTPLTSIRGYAEGIEKGVITDYPRTGKTIAAQTEKMSRLVEEILCMAKLESGSMKPEKEEIELTAFLQDCLMPFEGTVISRSLDVTLDLQPMTVSADPDKLEHAVTNLLTNALKYARTKIVISCGGGVFRIANDCDSLSDDTLAHLFERFYTGRDGNTGIGLSLAKDLIELHGWRISAVRTEDGICFVTDTRRRGRKQKPDKCETLPPPAK